MATHSDMSSANAKSTERLAALVARLTTEDMKRSLGVNWTVGFALAHLAFWDARQIAALGRFANGEPFPSEDMATNAALELIADAFNPATIGQAAVRAAEQLDAAVQALTKQQRDELHQANLSYAINRAPHRDEHLQQIEEGLG